MLVIIYLLEDEQELSLGMLIRPKRIYNFCLLHACFGWYCYEFDTLSYLFTHIWTNLLTQCTQCQFLSTDVCELQVFTDIYSAQKIPGKIYKKSERRKLPEHRRPAGEGPPPSQTAIGRGPTPSRARRPPGRGWLPSGSPSGFWRLPSHEFFIYFSWNFLGNVNMGKICNSQTSADRNWH